MADGEPVFTPEDVIVPVHREELRSMRDILPGLLAGLRADGSQTIDLIRAAAADGQAEAMARAAHGLGGMAGSVGGQKLAGLCRELDLKGRHGTVEGAGDIVLRIETEFANLCAALQLILDEEQ